MFGLSNFIITEFLLIFYSLVTNVLYSYKGTIIEIQEGAVNAIVKINVGNDNILTADITIQSVKDLGLAVGKEVVAVIKSTSVMVGVE